jgi:putative ABC transport system permease protein
VNGTLPKKASDGAALHAAILRAKGLRIGDVFGQMVDEEDGTPGRFTVVGEIDGPSRLGVIDLTYASIPDFVLARRESFQVVYARAGRKAESDRYLREAKSPGRDDLAFRVVDEAFVRKRVAKTMRNLPLLIGFVTGSVALIVALVTALLNVIAFQARVDEFGLLLAVGHRRGRLAKKLALETGITSTIGWLFGLGLGFGALAVYRTVSLEPRGILMSLWDTRPLVFSLAVPGLSASVSAIAMTTKLHRMDPVQVLQRRGT